MERRAIFQLIFAGEMLNTLLVRTLVRRILASFSAIILFSAILVPALRSQTVDTFQCGRSATVNIGVILRGETLFDSLFIVNRDSVNSFFSIGSSTNSAFLWSTSPNIQIPYNTSKVVTAISFSDTTIGEDSSTLIMEADSDSSCRTIYTISATVAAADSNNSVIELNNTAHEIVGFKSDTVNQTLQISLLNNSDSTITFDTIELQKNSDFSIVSSSRKYPATVTKGSSISLKLAFTANKPGYYTDFVIMPGEPIIPLSVQGRLLPNDAVQTAPSGSIYFSIYPNPSQGQATIHTENISQAHATVTDVLGRIIQTADFTGDWNWSAPCDGTYFVDIIGTATDGTRIQETKRIAVMH